MRDPDGSGVKLRRERQLVSVFGYVQKQAMKAQHELLEARCDHWKWWWGASEGDRGKYGKVQWDT